MCKYPRSNLAHGSRAGRVRDVDLEVGQGNSLEGDNGTGDARLGAVDQNLGATTEFKEAQKAEGSDRK